MAKHLFTCCFGRGEMSLSELETRISDWVNTNGEWVEDNFDHTLSETNTELDGSGQAYYTITVRFHKDDTKDNMLHKFTDKLKDKLDWYRVGYHDCIGHDSDTTHSCNWDDKTEWAAKDVSIPSGVRDFNVTN